MRYRTEYKTLATLIDHDGTKVKRSEVYQSANGFACIDDNVLNYAVLPFANECDLRRGFPRVTLDDKGRLYVSVEVDSKRPLSSAELKSLKADFAGQLTDGIGAGCFDAIAAETGFSIQMVNPVKAACTQQEGEAWRPTKSTAKTNNRCIASMLRLLDDDDAQAKSRQAASSKSKKQNSASSKVARPNYSKLLRLLSKVDREFIQDQIEKELTAIGSDLSQMDKGTFPSGNFRDPRFLRLLLKAGLPPEALDSKGHSLLFQAAGTPACLEILLKLKVDVNQTGTDVLKTTPLMRAASLGKLKCVEMLLNAGADSAARDLTGQTAIDHIDDDSRDRKAIEALLKKKSKR